jgi:hypothetical protein
VTCGRGWHESRGQTAGSQLDHPHGSTEIDDMATKLEKTIKRELEHKGKLYTITISPEGVKAVEKGKRLGQELSWDTLITGDASLRADLNVSNDAMNAGG